MRPERRTPNTPDPRGTGDRRAGNRAPSARATGQRRCGFQIRDGVCEKLPPGLNKPVLPDHDRRRLLVTEFPVDPVGGCMDTLRELSLRDLAKAVHEGAAGRHHDGSRDRAAEERPARAFRDGTLFKRFMHSGSEMIQ